MVEFIVLVEGQRTGLGTHAFQTAPHVGDYISMNDREGKGQAYKVKAVVHASDGKGDLIVEHVGTETELLSRLLPG